MQPNKIDMTPFELAGSRIFWYVATPYSKFGGGIDAAFHAAAMATAALVKLGVQVYSPIVACHPLCNQSYAAKLDPMDGEAWAKRTRPLLLAAGGVIVVRFKGWTESAGVQAEMAFARNNKRRVITIAPSALGMPAELDGEPPPAEVHDIAEGLGFNVREEHRQTSTAKAQPSTKQGAVHRIRPKDVKRK